MRVKQEALIQFTNKISTTVAETFGKIKERNNQVFFVKEELDKAQTSFQKVLIAFLHL